MATIIHNTTAEQLLHVPGLGRCELLRGALVMMSPAGLEHGRVVGRIHARLGPFVEQHSLGITAGAETGFLIGRDPDTVRAPDVAFIRADRVPDRPNPGFFEGAPDLAIEVLSPGDRASEVLAKVRDWLQAGCRAVWVVDPATRTVHDHGGTSQLTILGESDELSGGDVVPGFRVRVGEVFAV